MLLFFWGKVQGIQSTSWPPQASYQIELSRKSTANSTPASPATVLTELQLREKSTCNVTQSAGPLFVGQLTGWPQPQRRESWVF